MSARNVAARAVWAREAERSRRAQTFRHVGWCSQYAPTLSCPHDAAREVENDEPVEAPVPLPESWFPVRLRHWTCAGCGAAVNPNAFTSDRLTPLPEDVRKAWWENWRAHERSVNGFPRALPSSDPAVTPERDDA